MFGAEHLLLFYRRTGVSRKPSATAKSAVNSAVFSEKRTRRYTVYSDIYTAYSVDTRHIRYPPLRRYADRLPGTRVGLT
jgi:hypothetical protein